ncbi:hypothetical protein [Streptomyces sp. B21-083]|uniref:hypothetical protein n=1 Tax=Streptomyces sp. B21-083 TaxID=3039410 RepID=UPI002FF25477
MPAEWKPPKTDADMFAQYKGHIEGERKLKPKMEEAADRALANGATVGQLARHTGLTPEVFRRRARKLGIEHKRPPTVGPLKQPTPEPAPKAVAAAPLPPERADQPEPRTDTTDPLPLPELSPRGFRKAMDLAMRRAEPEQRERLNRTEKVAEQLDRDKTNDVLKAAFEMGLLTPDEVLSIATPERPASSEETSG